MAFEELVCMFDSYTNSINLPELGLWDKIKEKGMPLSFDLEVTARCNNKCHHCYICLPPKDRQATMNELTLDEINHLAGEAVSMGAIWCLITGGEPLLRHDFFEIYQALKRKGLLVSIFTNATLIKEEHIELFRKYPPRDIEVSVYGVTQDTYEKVTCNPGSFKAFMQGLNMLLDNKIKVRLKAMAIRSNFHELPQIAKFCRERTMDYFRFDPLLHLRLDRDQTRNEAIKSERLTFQEIAALEKADSERFHALEKSCDKLINPDFCDYRCDHLFHCGAGKENFVLGYDGNFRLCSSLHQPECVYNLRMWSLADIWNNFVPKVREIRSGNKEFLKKCRVCPIINLCLWCPAHAYLEEGALDAFVPYFCKVANARAVALGHTQEAMDD
jgi:radical SAM protein with 4Fe4S-binding SPASM domain